MTEPATPADEDGLQTARRLEEEGRAALCAHAHDLGAAARARHGGIEASTLEALLGDDLAVRFPTELRFEASRLEPGEFAVVLPRGERASDGYTLFVHPFFEARPEDVPWLVAYHLVVVNYGEAACSEAAEAFGAALMGVSTEDYYARVCALADELAESASA